MTVQTIPILDLECFAAGTPLQQRLFAEGVGKSLESVGFFALVNHGVSRALIAEAYQVAQVVFQLPERIKRGYEDPQGKGQQGFTPFAREHAKGQEMPDLKEFWHVRRELPAEHPPAELRNLWPEEVPAFRPVMGELYQQLERCAEYLLQAIALYLGEPQERFTEMVREGATLLRVIHYPPIPPDAPPQSLRAAAHEDINLITLLCEATAPGLELLQRDGTWLPILAMPGQLIVDSGDMLQQLTNGLFQSTTHRVVNPPKGEGAQETNRLSIPFFVHPRLEVDLTPLPGCVARTGGRRRFPSRTAGEYLEERLKEIGLA